MSDLVSGNVAKVMAGASDWCAFTGWSINIDQAVLTTVTQCSAPWTITARGNKTITGTISAKVDDDARLESIMFTDALVALRLYTDTVHYWSGNARLGQITESANTESGAIEDISVAFTSDGTWTFT